MFNYVIETKTRVKVRSNDPILMWAIRWAAMVTSRYLVGKDGRTAQERKRGRRCRTPIATFGEVVWYTPMAKSREKNKLEAKWERGIWFGTAREAHEMICCTSRWGDPMLCTQKDDSGRTLEW